MIIATADPALASYVTGLHERLGPYYSPANFNTIGFLKSEPDIARIDRHYDNNDARIFRLRFQENEYLALKIHPDKWFAAGEIYGSEELIQKINACDWIVDVYSTNRRELRPAVTDNSPARSREDLSPARFSWEVTYGYLPGHDLKVALRTEITKKQSERLLTECIDEINKADFLVVGSDSSDFILCEDGRLRLTDLNKLSRI